MIFGKGRLHIGAAFLRHYGPEIESPDRYTCSHSGVVVRTAVANLLSSTRRTTPVHRRSLLIALWLVGIEVNPGLVKQINNSKNSIKMVTLGTLNARSIVNKAADFHLTVEEENLDVVAITETWVPSDAPNAVSEDFIRSGYSVINASRSDGRRGGGLDIVYREHLKVAHVSLKIAPSAFEVLVDHHWS